jgi:dihydroneopterin aldolase
MTVAEVDTPGDTTRRGTKAVPTDAEVEEYTLRLHAIRFLAHVGASRRERAAPQRILVDVVLTLPAASLPASDRVRDVVDYDAVVRSVVEEGVTRPHRLLETYAIHVVNRLLVGTPATKVRVSATKCRAPTTYPLAAAIVEVVGVRPLSPRP